MARIQGDEAFYYWHNEGGELEGMILNHVDNFILAGTPEFREEISPSWMMTHLDSQALMYTKRETEL